MQNRKWLRALYLTSCAFALCLTSLATDNIPQSSKAQYKDVPSYLDICRNPGKFAQKDESKIKFKIVFKAKADSLPAKYEEIYAKSYALILPDGDIPEAFTKVPIVYSTARGKLRDEIMNLELNKPIILYATLRFKMFKDPKKKDVEAEKLFVIMVDDIETPELAVKDNFDASKDGDFTPAKSKRVDIQYEKYLGRKVSIAFHFKDTDNRIPPEIAKLTDISNETHFVILPTEVFHTTIIAERDNEKCVEPMIDAQTGDIIVLNGVLKKAEDPTSQKHIPIYFFYVYSLSLDPAPPKDADASKPAAAQTPTPIAQATLAQTPIVQATPAQTPPAQAVPVQATPAQTAKSAPQPSPLEIPTPTPAKQPEPTATKPGQGNQSSSPLDDWKSILQEQAK